MCFHYLVSDGKILLFDISTASRLGKDLVSSNWDFSVWKCTEGRGHTATVTMCCALPYWVKLFWVAACPFSMVCVLYASLYSAENNSRLQVVSRDLTDLISWILSWITIFFTWLHFVIISFLMWSCQYTTSSLFPRVADFCQKPSFENQGWCYIYHDQTHGKCA